jgi:hypothetical protein
MPRYNTRSTAANAVSAPVPTVLAPSTMANKSYADAVAAPAPAAYTAAAPAPATVATPVLAAVATPAPAIVAAASTASPSTGSAPLPSIVPPVPTVTNAVQPSYAAVVTGTALVPNSIAMECNPSSTGVCSTAPVITPNNDDHPRVPTNSTPHSPFDVLLDAAALAADSPIVAPAAEDDRLFESQLFEVDSGLPTFSLDNFQPDLKVAESDDEVDDASSCNDDLPVFIREEKAAEVVVDLATAVDHTNTVDLTDGAKFALGTTNHTKKYTTRKRALLAEFVGVLKKTKKSMQGFWYLLVMCHLRFLPLNL